MSSTELSSYGNQIRFDNVEGIVGKFNNLLYIPGRNSGGDNGSMTVICYFGGDIQNFRDQIPALYGRYVERYCYEAIGERLREWYGSSFNDDNEEDRWSIVVIQPCSYHQRTFACYHNFLPNIVDCYGTPGQFEVNDEDHEDYHEEERSTEPYDHLRMLITNLMSLVDASSRERPKQPKSENRGKSSTVATTNLPRINLQIIGFSKGCSVLNQLLYSIRSSYHQHRSSSDSQFELTKLYFLDSGHNGTSDAWITDSSILESIILNYCPKLQQISIGVTGYQLNNRHKQWLAQEENKFYNLLLQLEKNQKKNFKVTRLYLDETTMWNNNKNKMDDLLDLHFQIIDRLIDGELE